MRAITHAEDVDELQHDLGSSYMLRLTKLIAFNGRKVKVNYKTNKIGTRGIYSSPRGAQIDMAPRIKYLSIISDISTSEDHILRIGAKTRKMMD